MIETKMRLVDWLDDLCVRFIVNLPKEELASVERICFQVEEAQWFYEDFVRPLDPQLPTLNLRQFCLLIFQHCPLFSMYDAQAHSLAFSEFLAYKTRVPVRGAIMLNEAMDEVVLVKGWKKSASWSFPRGKINKDEKDLNCAIREVYEETGYDIRAAGLIGDEDNVKFIEVTMREQHMKLFVFKGIPKHTHFEPRTRKEISSIQWYRLSDLPTLKKMKQQQNQEGRGENLAVLANKFYMVAPFLAPLKKIITQLKKMEAANAKAAQVTSSFITFNPAPHEVLRNDRLEELPSKTDMSRLMDQLRQSQQASRERDLPEASDQDISPSSTSVRLKNLLNVPSKPTVHSQGQGTTSSSREAKAKANAMLSLLRGGDTQQALARSVSGVQRPHTPLEQVFSQSSMPRSPKHYPRAQTNPAQQVSIQSPPPVFQYSPARIDNNASGRFTKPFAPFQQPLPYEKLVATHHDRALLQPLSIDALQAPAPYQRTGDPQFAQVSQHVPNAPPAIPPANKLPPPKLTAHSSALLNLFKTSSQSHTEPLSEPTSAQILDEETGPVEQHCLNISPQADSQKQTTPSSTATSLPHLAAVNASSINPSAVPVLSRAQQQQSLLNLFRGQADKDSVAPSPAAPLLPIEMPAQESSHYSRISSGTAKKIDASLTPQSLINGKVTIKRRPAAGATVIAVAPLSATVSGPLNMPQFEVLSKSTEAGGPEIAKPHRTNAPQLAQGTMRILSRPGTADSTSKALAAVKVRAHERTVERKQSPKRFQPQILRRPVEKTVDQTVVEKAATALPLPPRAPPKEMPAFDRPSSQSQEQKNALLSLLIKSEGHPSTPINPPLTSALTNIASPRSRVGSLNSLLSEGAMSGRQTPKASPADKKFLLGFLDGVVKEGMK